MGRPVPGRVRRGALERTRIMKQAHAYHKRLKKQLVEDIEEANKREKELSEEVELLTDALARIQEQRRPSWIVRLWRRIFGQLIYDGPENCGHCKYWDDTVHHANWKGICKILCSAQNDTQDDDQCKRFVPKRKYKRRVRP